MGQKNYFLKHVWKRPKFGERHTYVDSRSIANTNKVNSNKTISGHIMLKKRKSFKELEKWEILRFHLDNHVIKDSQASWSSATRNHRHESTKIKCAQPRNLYPVKRNFKIESNIHFQIKATDFTDERPALQGMLKSVPLANGTPEKNVYV